MRESLQEAFAELDRKARKARKEYWSSIGEYGRADAEPSEKSLEAWRRAVLAVTVEGHLP